jgi:hypothetical protein
MSPLPQSWSGVSSADHTENPTAFFIANGVTQEEIEEFQRQSMNNLIFLKLMCS